MPPKIAVVAAAFFAISFCCMPCSTTAMRVAVFGGSGFIGSRVCKILASVPGCRVVSVSRSGGPPCWFQDEEWTGSVDWVAADANANAFCRKEHLRLLDNDNDNDNDNCNDNSVQEQHAGIGKIDAAVSCVGNVRPSQEWKGFWGLHWDESAGIRENGLVNANIAEVAKELGAKKFVFVSVSYDTAKALEGPLPGYLDGKRQAEESAYQLFHNDALVIGPSLVYGGGRFVTAGNILKAILSSPVAKAYQASNNALRGLSPSSEYDEDWVTNMVLHPPLEVEVLARAIAAGVTGSLDGRLLLPRRQGFYSTEGKPVEMVPVPFLDANEIQETAEQFGTDQKLAAAAAAVGGAGEKEDSFARETSSEKRIPQRIEPPPPFEGALIGYRPLLYPIPIAAFFLSTFLWATNIDYNNI